jgi:nanoRNase/pAp phosphatase (c-di-AMP/oligoRNAs hydrolase)
MVSGLMLGCGGAGFALVESISTRYDELLVVDPDEALVEQLRNDSIDAVVGDVTDPAMVDSLNVDPDIVLVAADDVSVTEATTTLAQRFFPGTYLVAFASSDATKSDIDSLDRVADGVFEPGRAIVDHLADVVDDGQTNRLRGLHNALEDIDGTLGIFTHDNPDPDAIASAVALSQIAARHGIDAQPAYFGRISHQENRAFVNLLDLELQHFDSVDEVDYGGVALVDHSTPGVNDQLSRETSVDIVIDHHPSNRSIEAGFVDVREAVGATSTLLVDYLRGYHIDVDAAVATALLFGIRVDTNDFTRGTTPADFDAAANLVQYVDQDVLKRIESPSLSADTFEIIARAINNRERRDSVLTSCVGSLSDRDALAQAAERLLNMEDVSVTLVYGHQDGSVYVSARSRGVKIDLGETLREAFSDLGSAGGHEDMAGAQLSLGVFEEVTAEAELTRMIEDVITPRFFDVVAPETLEE